MRPAEIKKKGSTEIETVSRMVEHIGMKDAAPQLFQVEKETRQNVFTSSRLEQLRIQQAAEISRKLSVVKFQRNLCDYVSDVIEKHTMISVGFL